MYGEWGDKHANADIFVAVSCLSIVRSTNAEQTYQQWGQLTHFHCTIAPRVPPQYPGSHVSYVSLADVR